MFRYDRISRSAVMDFATMLVDRAIVYVMIWFIFCSSSVFFFFFQAEDGIRDLTVTGVQTCALPISAGTARIAGYDIFEQSLEARRSLGYLPEQVPLYPEMRVEEYLTFSASLRMRSEERRVGKEGRSRWSPYH